MLHIDVGKKVVGLPALGHGHESSWQSSQWHLLCLAVFICHLWNSNDNNRHDV